MISASFQAAAKNGLAGGPAQHASGLETAIFTNGFVQAMRPTMLTPIVFLFAGAATCLFIKRARSQDETAPAVTEPTSAAAG